MRRLLFALLYIALLAASCAPQAASPPPQAAQKLSQQPEFTPSGEIRFALVGSPRDVNVWALFDEEGASYADYAPRFEYFPRLYHLAPPDFSFHSLAAQGLPSSMIREGDFYSATINLRTDLRWTDDSLFTAEDVAFTVNTALAFDLGFDWRAAYPRDILDRAEVVNPYVVKFIFKQKPGVGLWHYGALQGRIVQKEFWQSRIAPAEELLPPPEWSADIDKARARLAQVQFTVNDLTAKLRAVRETGAEGRDIEIILTQRKLDLGHAKNNLNKVLERYQSALATARRVLYDLDDHDEPTLGAWMFESKTKDIWVNEANPAFPFGEPHFEHASYHFFDTERDAVAAFEKNEVDFILSPNGLSHTIAGTAAHINPTYSARFLVFHPSKPQFADPAFRSALSCMIDREELARDALEGKAAALGGFIVSAQWRTPNLAAVCAEMTKSQRIEYAVELLKSQGYSWVRQPGADSAGKNLKTPKGETFPKIVLSAPYKESDALRYTAAKYIAEQAQYLGIPFAIKEMSADDVVYAVYSSQQYDAALLGWRLGEYPQYLCDWFDGRASRLYVGSTFTADCTALTGETKLDDARKILYRIEPRLMSELPFIPLFVTIRAEAYQNLSYPAAGVPNGWSSLYGAPSYAVPMP